ncbi:hypothetical protein MMYC01_203041 [Madurella mycetomatis]|uniref:Uncharacterized protein n=1 Tax=Madurella mycetomatis TaxID=100816 RepID=A0A175W6I4_9PEZI|nr:hypothetical protein MMYC01_203041 [Madurella mycetomatis]
MNSLSSTLNPPGTTTPLATSTRFLASSQHIESDSPIPMQSKPPSGSMMLSMIPRAQGHANELESAQLAVDCLSGSVELSGDAERLVRIQEMIKATATHIVPASLNGAEAADAAMFLDMDLSILGADERTFDEYEAAVRKEYNFVAEDVWREGRMAVLKRFGERERIYHSELFRGLFEDAARRNLKRSIERLAA